MSNVTFLGKRVIRNIMKNKRLRYDCDLFEITATLENQTKGSDREKWGVDTTLSIVETMKELEKEEKRGDLDKYDIE